MDHLTEDLRASHTVGIQKTRVVRFITELAVSHPIPTAFESTSRDQQFGDARHFADIVEEGKAQGCIRPDVDSEEAAWRIHERPLARSHGPPSWAGGTSDVGLLHRIYQSILKSIATDPDSVSLEDDSTEHSLITQTTAL